MADILSFPQDHLVPIASSSVHRIVSWLVNLRLRDREAARTQNVPKSSKKRMDPKEMRGVQMRSLVATGGKMKSGSTDRVERFGEKQLFVDGVFSSSCCLCT